MRVLVFEEDPDISDSLRLLLVQYGCSVQGADSEEEALQLARSGGYDIILLSLPARNASGQDLLRRLRGQGVTTPVLVISDTAAPDTRVRALGLGADDYVTRPFYPAELLARMRAITRRCLGHASSVIRIGPISVDIEAKTVEAHGLPVRVTGKEYQLLELLALRKGAVVSRWTILDHLYGGPEEPGPRTIDVHVCRLRRKLQAAGAQGPCLLTAWGRGFMLRTSDPEPDDDKLVA